jgi:hypothetical protein
MGLKSSLVADTISKIAEAEIFSTNKDDETRISSEDVKSESNPIDDENIQAMSEDSSGEFIKDDKYSVQDIGKSVENHSKMLHLLSDQIKILTNESQSNKKVFENPELLGIREDEELNEEIRVKSEKLIFTKLKKSYPKDRIRWFNKDGESNSSCDFTIINKDESIEYYIECKASKNNIRYFLMTKSEWDLFRQNKYNYQVYFVAKALTDQPEIIKIDNLLEWMLCGKVVPYSNNYITLKPERIVLSIV